MSQKDKNRIVIEAISSFEDNWDNYGASKIPNKVIENTRLLNELLEPAALIFPTDKQSIRFEWEMNGAYTEMEVFEDRVEIFCEKA